MRRVFGIGLVALLGAAVGGVFGCGGDSSRRGEPDRRDRSPARTEPGGFDADLAARLQATLERVREHQSLPGAAAAVVIPGAGVWTGGVGEADTGSHRPVTDRTLFAIGSITKTFVAALMLKLAEDGVLDLDDRLSRWVPEFPDSRRMSLRQLLNHTSGTRDFVEQRAFWKAQLRDDDVVWSPQRTLSYAPANASEPGEDWSYSGTNYVLAGLVIERATHSTVARQLHRRLLQRARFLRIVLQGDERQRGPVAVGYQDVRGDADLEPTPNNGYVPSTTEATTAWTAGGMLASAKDLARAGDGVFRGSLISDASRHEMTHFIPTRMRFLPEYGLGLARADLGGVQVWTHSGNIFGFHAELAYIPEQEITVAALSNKQTNAPGQEALIDALVADVSDSP
jgi:D-alanyl-D-alanine carboxypeptidase